MHSLYKTYREIWEERLKVLSCDSNLLSEDAYQQTKDSIEEIRKQICNITNNSAESQEHKKTLQSQIKLLKYKLELNDPIFKEILNLKTKLETSKANEFNIPTQVVSPPTLGLKTLEIPSGHVYNPSLSIAQNADASMNAWIKLKKYCELNYRMGTWSLAACSDIAYVYSQEFNVEI